jgi:hypothetical protein
VGALSLSSTRRRLCSASINQDPSAWYAKWLARPATAAHGRGQGTVDNTASKPIDFIATKGPQHLSVPGKFVSRIRKPPPPWGGGLSFTQQNYGFRLLILALANFHPVTCRNGTLLLGTSRRRTMGANQRRLAQQINGFLNSRLL